jgi:acetyl-CoA synthetase
MHTTAGYLVGTYATTKWVFDIKEDDVYWCTADIGWVTGHSYVVYGPLANGATVVMYEGAPDWPEKDRFWQIVERYGVTIFYTAPTAIRAFMRWGTGLAEEARSVEPASAWLGWRTNQSGSLGLVPPLHRRREMPVVDTWWQTETGAIPDHAAARPDDDEARLRDEAVPGREGGNQERGGRHDSCWRRTLTLTRPWPSMLRGIYGDPGALREAVLEQVDA